MKCLVCKGTPSKDPLCQLSDKIKEHILEEIIPTGLKKKAATDKHDIRKMVKVNINTAKSSDC